MRRRRVPGGERRVPRRPADQPGVALLAVGGPSAAETAEATKAAALRGMAEVSERFRERGGEVYLPAE